MCLINKQIQIIKNNQITFGYCFLFNLDCTFNIKKFLCFIKMIKFPLNQLYFFTSQRLLKRNIKKALLPCWNHIFLNEVKKAKFYPECNSIRKFKGEHRKSIKNIKTQVFSTFLKQFRKNNVSLLKYYVFIDSCGLTYEVLKGFQKYIQNIVLLEIYTEVYKKWIGQTTQEQVFDLLSKNAFKLVYKLPINSFQNKSIWIKK